MPSGKALSTTLSLFQVSADQDHYTGDHHDDRDKDEERGEEENETAPVVVHGNLQILAMNTGFIVAGVVEAGLPGRGLETVFRLPPLVRTSVSVFRGAEIQLSPLIACIPAIGRFECGMPPVVVSIPFVGCLEVGVSPFAAVSPIFGRIV